MTKRNLRVLRVYTHDSIVGAGVAMMVLRRVPDGQYQWFVDEDGDCHPTSITADSLREAEREAILRWGRGNNTLHAWWLPRHEEAVREAAGLPFPDFPDTRWFAAGERALE
jgi:hypothetical protein